VLVIESRMIKAYPAASPLPEVARIDHHEPAGGQAFVDELGVREGTTGA